MSTLTPACDRCAAPYEIEGSGIRLDGTSYRYRLCLPHVRDFERDLAATEARASAQGLSMSTAEPKSTEIATHCSGCGDPLDAATLALLAMWPGAFGGARVAGECCDPTDDGYGEAGGGDEG